MPYKLYYFNARGHAEIIRLVFAAAGENYEDIRLSPAQWEEFKNTKAKGTAFLPLLQVSSGEFLPETKVIVRYLAREFGLYGETNAEKAVIDLTLEIVRQLAEKGFAFKKEKDSEKKKELKETFIHFLATEFAVLEGMLKQRKGGDGFMLGDKISIADISVFVWLEHFMPELPDGLERYPKLKGLEERVKTYGGIAEWLAKRPGDDFEGVHY